MIASELAARAVAVALSQLELELDASCRPSESLSLGAPMMDGDGSSPLGTALMLRKVRNQVARGAAPSLPVPDAVASMVLSVA